MKGMIILALASSLICFVGCHSSISPERAVGIRKSLDSLEQKLGGFRHYYSSNLEYFGEFREFVKDSMAGQVTSYIQADSNRKQQWQNIQDNFIQWQVTGQVLGSEWQIQLDEAASWLKRAEEDRIADKRVAEKWLSVEEKMQQLIQEGLQMGVDWDSITDQSDRLISVFKGRNHLFFQNPKGFRPILSL